VEDLAVISTDIHAQQASLKHDDEVLDFVVKNHPALSTPT
jgi:hypothetical protein